MCDSVCLLYSLLTYSVSDAHDHLAYRRAREHVLDGVGHALEAVEGALAVDERDELA